MMEKEFLPQYAAHAVSDLRAAAKLIRRVPDFEHMAKTNDTVAELIERAVHVVLPANGVIYRENSYGGSMPTPDEIESLVGIPAPVTCFEYPWESAPDYTPTRLGEGRAPKRITLVVDNKQLPGRISSHIQLFSVAYQEAEARFALRSQWMLSDSTACIPMPLQCMPHASDPELWMAKMALYDISRLRPITDPELAAQQAGQWRTDITALVQCCHALRAGATLEERTEKSAARRWKMEKRGVGGFTYHVLKLPKGSVRHDGVPAGTHDSPRFHVRRAHIRKLPSGVLTFVRQCFVGDPEKGVVGKHYKVQRP